LKEIKRTKLIASIEELDESLEASMKKRTEILQSDMQKFDVALANALQNKDTFLAATILECRRGTASTIANLNLCTAQSRSDQIRHRIQMGKVVIASPRKSKRTKKANLLAMVKDRKRQVAMATQS
jgi:hypothetical protein